MLVTLLGTTTFGQGPLESQVFAPADVSTYGGPIAPSEGYFFQFDALYWTISAPKSQVVGAPGETRLVSYGPHPISDQDLISDQRVETSTLDTGDLKNNFSIGNRFEFGQVEGPHGWMVDVFQLRNQGDVLVYPQADVVFKDPPQGDPNGTRLLQGDVPLFPFLYPTNGSVVVRDLPVTLYNVEMVTQTKTWGVEASYLHRFKTFHNGGTLEVFGGARYLELNDYFGIHAGADPGDLVVPSFLSDSYWFTSADNHIVGPQIGARWFKKQGRWTFSTEGRFMAGLNCQNFHQSYNIGPNLQPGGVEGNGNSGGNGPRTGSATGSGIYNPTAMAPSAGGYDAYARVFTPLMELRVEGRYQITRSFSFHAGWTGFWMDNIARANAAINYQVPAMGLDLSNNKQNLFMDGLTIGFDVNR
jgi:hypothetical protein